MTKNNHAIIINDIDNVNEINNFNFVDSKHRRLIEFIEKSILKNDYIFRDFHYVTTLIKKTRKNKRKNCCLK